MIFIDYGSGFAFCCLFGFILLGVWGFRASKKWGPRVRILVRVASSLFVVLCVLIGIVLEKGIELRPDYATVYSPDGTQTLRIEETPVDSAYGTEILLYWNHGFSHVVIFQGPWKSVRSENIHWLNNSEVAIDYKNAPKSYRCNSSKRVRVYVRNLSADPSKL
jgi:hypothetical protein